MLCIECDCMLFLGNECQQWEDAAGVGWWNTWYLEEMWSSSIALSWGWE